MLLLYGVELLFSLILVTCVQEWNFCFLISNFTHLSTWGTKGEMQDKGSDSGVLYFVDSIIPKGVLIWILLSIRVNVTGIPSQYWLRWKRLSKHSSRRLETCPEHKHHHLWVVSPFHGIQIQVFIKHEIVVAFCSLINVLTGTQSRGSTQSWCCCCVERQPENVWI